MMKKILVVDDDFNELETMRLALKNEKYDVQTADNGKTALELIKKDGISLIILDVKMPAIKGPELLALIRGNLGHKVKIIYVTMVPRANLDLKGIDGFVQYTFEDKNTSLRESLKEGILSGKAVIETLELAVSAFERGDYSLAKERGDKAKGMILLERKGNPLVFLYLYWPFILIGLILLSLATIILYRRYQKYSISEKILALNKEEETIRGMMQKSQKSYFSGTLSPGEYALIKERNEKRVSKIIKERLTLRNRRVNWMRAEKVLEELEKERSQVESKIQNIQEGYYKNKTLSEKEYQYQFQKLNERLAEIEDEATTLAIKRSKNKEKWIVVKGRKE